jgi:cytochrome o ubiquinol oxidase operon protein cyoD
MPTFKSYLTGFIISMCLTLAAYFAVVSRAGGALLIILGLAIAQLIVQLTFFLHLNKGEDSRWNLVVFASTVSIILILVIGSIWIMDHLNYNMSPQQQNDYINGQDGI